MIPRGLGTTEAEDFVAFAIWAFGPQGLPSLQVLAYGDFSHQDRYHGQQFLLRRRNIPQSGSTSQLSFESACVSDPWTWTGVSVDGADFLSACPRGGLMESPYEN